MTNKSFCLAETLFLTTSANNMYLSSSLVKQLARFGADISDLFPEVLLERIRTRLREIQPR